MSTKLQATRLQQRTPTYWAEFPDSYRAEQIATIARWIAVGDSGVVVGGSGAGKSNLVGFITARHDIVCDQLPGNVEDYAFVHLDVNSLPSVNTPFFYRSMLLALQQTAQQIDPALLVEINKGTALLANLEDTLGLHYVLQQAHDLLINGAGKQIVWLIDRFDEAVVRLEPSTLNSLRSLRDNSRLKGRLSFILFTRHPLARLRDPRDYDEFHEIVAPNSCWIGPMVDRDARWLSAQMADRHGVQFSDDAVSLLIELSGGLPAFLKAACSALATGMLQPGESAYIWLDRLLAQQPVLRNCQEMWDDLKPEERTALGAVVSGVPETQLDATATTYLEASTLLVRRKLAIGTGSILRIFSPIFELYVLRQQSRIGGISLDPQTGAIKANDRTLHVKLSPPEHRLLAYLVERRGELCERETLFTHVWPDASSMDEAGFTKLAETVGELRAKLELLPGSSARIEEVAGRGYTFVDQARAISISIDEDKFQQQVQKIVDTDFFRNLEQRARDMRQTRQEKQMGD
jgi:DNA-binding winged helix-turn-helix (wHTH) protein